ncbi:MAG: late competence development ComFB family protein [Lachnospiraceae bacterium]|nr:late competence development ComFB family protein [Lachnospiraceae bacterium]
MGFDKREGVTLKNKILLINNDEQVQEILFDFLDMDYECVTFKSSAECMTFLENTIEQVELVILDLNEAVSNDFMLLKGIRNHYLYGEIPVLMIAEWGQLENVALAVENGADDLLIKPIYAEIAKRRVKNMINIGANRKIHNIMEDIIESEINNNIDTLNICPCPKCRKDLLTLTLNNVKPRYIDTEKGQSFVIATRHASVEDSISLLADITRYALIIGENPRHE